MLKIGLCGCNGRMGKVITDIVSKKENMQIVAGFDAYTEKLADYPVYADPHEFTGACDVIIDFSNVSSLDMLLDYCVKTKTPVIFCTTGYDKEQLAKIREASAVIPVFRSGNMSIGINLMMDLLRKAATVLGDGYDVEITEKHHNQKLDAPSGTALMLADAVSEALPYDAEYVYDRHERRIRKLKVVYSKEPAMTPIDDMAISCRQNCICPPGTARKCTQRRQVPGSTAFVPAVAGLIIAGEVVKDLTGVENKG